MPTTTRVRDLMTSPTVTVPTGASSLEVIDVLVRNNIRSVAVVDEHGHLSGIVSESDLVLSAAYGKDDQRALFLVAEIIQGHPAGWVDRVSAQTAGSLMTADVTTIGPNDDIAEASRRLLRRRCGQLPVVDEGLVVGMLSRHDVVRSLACPDVITAAAHTKSARRAEPRELSTQDCLTLLGLHDVGRVGYLYNDHPQILPVNYVMDGGLIVFRTDPGEKLDAIPLRRVAFEIDGVTDGGAWSVVAGGHAREVTTALGDAYTDLRSIPMPLLVAGTKEHWIAIEITDLSGRRFE